MIRFGFTVLHNAQVPQELYPIRQAKDAHNERPRDGH